MANDNEKGLIKIISLEDSQKILKLKFDSGKKSKFQISLPGSKPKELIAKDIEAVNVGNSGLNKGYLIFKQENGFYQLAVQDKSLLKVGWVIADDKTRTAFINVNK